MKKAVPFDLFEPGQTIYFDILRLAELEKQLGESILNIIRKQDAGVNFCIAGLSVGLRHHYPKATPLFVAQMMENFLGEGGRLDDLAVPIIEAIVETGLFGNGRVERKNGEGTE